MHYVEQRQAVGGVPNDIDVYTAQFTVECEGCMARTHCWSILIPHLCALVLSPSPTPGSHAPSSQMPTDSEVSAQGIPAHGSGIRMSVREAGPTMSTSHSHCEVCPLHLACTNDHAAKGCVRRMYARSRPGSACSCRLGSAAGRTHPATVSFPGVPPRKCPN